MPTDRTGFNTVFSVMALLLLAVPGSKSGPTTPIIYTYYSETSLTWYQAAQYCLDQNGTLAKIPNEIVASVLEQSFQENEAWIGLHKPAAGDYRWMDSLSLGDYQPWSWQNDNADGDICVRVHTVNELQWIASSCTIRRRFVCETSGDECNFTTYRSRIPSKNASLVYFATENDCKRVCLSYYNNSEECIGYAYRSVFQCLLYAGANLSVQLPTVNGIWVTTNIKTCYAVQENSDIITESIAPIAFPNCQETSTSPIVYEATENAKATMTMKTASSVMENGQAAISVTTVDGIGISATTVHASMPIADISLESSSHDNVHIATERSRVAMESAHAVISITPVEVGSLSAMSVDDVLTTTAENNLESSLQDVSVTSEASAMINNNLESSATMCSCPCPRALLTNISITKEEIVKALLVKKTTLSSFRRKKESSKDDRPSAQAVGQVGVALLAAVGVIILLFDADVLIKFLKGCLNPRKRLAI